MGTLWTTIVVMGIEPMCDDTRIIHNVV